uniref:Uncharacterized protein n=1 Tax=Arundo donax TaxID=35708 RepID=A0A0A8ZIB4_ARUDO
MIDTSNHPSSTTTPLHAALSLPLVFVGSSVVNVRQHHVGDGQKPAMILTVVRR